MLPKNTTIALITIIASLSSASAIPAAAPQGGIAEIIPGPGPPSLESLGLTSEDLYYETIRKRKPSPLEKRFKLTCQDKVVGECQPVMPRLVSMDTKKCTVNGANAIFCTSGKAALGGSNVSGGGSASSYWLILRISLPCRDVAYGARKIVGKCNKRGGVAGANAAGGNGFLIT
ncbi:hypothetical protein BGW36DRAFT_357580 [Talaromyces proteolyticus]|uniref:Uncharacterized protein n=1 Tax=Talaromyces proteolyticus TaxID=1131652 RepID=A0AAD4KVU0_9EURO|nr:uncharacterized protein BGW36DRAFT_357580 [Talaromyces proteolyticus]KAH8700944.1 hypothetical protein BGW36DRAFT_357580 [Talaromyces proteolyticus]